MTPFCSSFLGACECRGGRVVGGDKDTVTFWEDALKPKGRSRHSLAPKPSKAPISPRVKAKVKATQVCTDRWMHKDDVVHTCNGILFSLKKEWNFDKLNSIDEPRKYIEWDKPDTKGAILHDASPRCLQFPNLQKQKVGPSYWGLGWLGQQSLCLGSREHSRDGQWWRLLNSVNYNPLTSTYEHG